MFLFKALIYGSFKNTAVKVRWLNFESLPLISSVWPPQGSGCVPLTRKLCYAVGGVPYQMTTVAMGFSLQIFLLDVVQVKSSATLYSICFENMKSCKKLHLNTPQMKAFYVSMILFLSRAWDAVSDPLVGYLVGLSTWTPIGRLTPWWVVEDLTHLADTRSWFPQWCCSVSQAGSVHPTGRLLLPAAVVCATRLDVSGRHRALVPRGHLPL